MALALTWADEGCGNGLGLGEELIFDAPHIYYDIAADAQLEYDDGTDTFFDHFHPEHEPPGPKAPPQRMLPEEDDAEEDVASNWAPTFSLAAHADEPTPDECSPRAHRAPAQESPLAFSAGPHSAVRNVDESPLTTVRCIGATRKRASPLNGGPLSELATGPNGTVVRRRPQGFSESEANTRANATERRLAARKQESFQASNSPAAAGKRARRTSSIGDLELRRLLVEHNSKIRRHANGRAPVPAGTNGSSAIGAAGGVASASAAPTRDVPPPQTPAEAVERVDAHVVAGTRGPGESGEQDATAGRSRAARAPAATAQATSSAIERRRELRSVGAGKGSGGAASATDGDLGGDGLAALLQSHNARVMREREQMREVRRAAAQQPAKRAAAQGVGDVPRPIGTSAIATTGRGAAAAAGGQRGMQPHAVPAPFAVATDASASAAPSAGASTRRPATASASVKGDSAQPPAVASTARSRGTRCAFAGAGSAGAEGRPRTAAAQRAPAALTGGSRTTSASQPAQSVSGARTEILGDSALLDLLRQHNSKFAPKPVSAAHTQTSAP